MSLSRTSRGKGGLVPIEGNRKKLNGPDPDYRYMMPPVITSTTSKHLVVDNMREVAKALEVEPTWIAKYLGVECGAPCKYNAKDGTARLSVGHASSRDSANRGERAVHLVHDFIDKYVLCPRPGCLIPEFSLFADKGILMSRCPACGDTLPVPDQRHKVTAFIVKELKAAAKRDKRLGKNGQRGGESKAKEATGDATTRAKRGKSGKNGGKKGGGKGGKGGKRGASHTTTGTTGAAGAGAGGHALGADDPEFAALAASFDAMATSGGGLGDDWTSSDDEHGADGGASSSSGSGRGFF